MSAAASLPMTPLEADRHAEGWRTGRLAARFVVRTMEGEADKPAARTLLANVVQRIEAIEVPPPSVVLPRADRLETAIRTALALAGADLSPEAITVLQDALR